MAKTIASPYLASPPDRIRAVGDQPNHTLYSSEEEPVIIPIQFALASGALTAQRATGLCRVVDQGSGVMRIYHPHVQATGLHVFFSRGPGASYTVDQSTAAEGYIEVNVSGSPTSVFDGYIVGRGIAGDGDPSVPSEVGDFLASRTLAERHQDRAVSSVPGLVVYALSFAVDGSGDPVPSSARGTLAFNVTHSGAGDYTVSTTVEMNSSWRFVTQVNGEPSVGTLGSAGNEINVLASADPAVNEEIVVLAIGPRGKDGKIVADEINTVNPRTQHIRTGTYPSFGLQRDTSFIPVQFSVDGSGDVDLTNANTVIPNNVAIVKSGTEYTVNFGAVHPELCVASFHGSGSSGSFVVDYSEVEDGNVKFDRSLSNTVVRGFIVACWTSER